MFFRRFNIVFLLCLTFTARAQEVVDYGLPKKYTLGGITVEGARYYDHSALRTISGLSVGSEIEVPGQTISKAIEKLWKQNLFSDVKILIDEIKGNEIFLKIELQERQRLSKFQINGIRKGQVDDIREEMKLVRGKALNEDVKLKVVRMTKEYFIDKGFLNVEVSVRSEEDTSLSNSVILIVDIDPKERVKVKEINIIGNNQLLDRQVWGAMKNTKRKKLWHVFAASKYMQEGFREDLKSIVSKYNGKGFRDAKIISDSVYPNDEKTINIDVHLGEGNKYYFGEIKWVGNKKYTNAQLDKILGIKKGDSYDQDKLNENLNMSTKGIDVSSLYMDEGYLSFYVNPVETRVYNDTIDFEIRIYEGQQARINKVTVVGNTKTNDHVVLREIRTKPGELFSRADIIRTQRELAQLGYFDPEKLGVNPTPNSENGTVDIEYVVEEKPSDQIELSGGWGAGQVVGTLGISFNNFSTRNFFKKGAWNPLPSGDGQRLSVRAQSNGTFYQSYNMSFTEPWLGGKTPTSLNISAYHSVQTNSAISKYISDDDQEAIGEGYVTEEWQKTYLDAIGNGQVRNIRVLNPNRQYLKITGVSAGIGGRMKWPDDYFTLYGESSYKYYDLQNWFGSFIFKNGYSNNISLKGVLSRSDVRINPIFPVAGSAITLTLQATPPYSSISSALGEDKDYTDMSAQEKYKFVEYHKWKFNAEWYSELTKNLVLQTKVGLGYLGYYNRNIGQSPFERFFLGGDGLTGFNVDGREIIRFRGYPQPSSNMDTDNNYGGGSIVSKYTMELRYPLSLNPSATIYGLTFVEAGGEWTRFKNYAPFDVNRAAGFGVRIFMPMFGLLGLDWGYRFDDVPGRPGTAGASEIHFTIGQNINSW